MPDWPPKVYPDHFYWSWDTAKRRINEEIVGPARRLLSRGSTSPSIQEALANPSPAVSTAVGNQPGSNYELYRRQAPSDIEAIGGMVGREVVRPASDILGKLWRGDPVLPRREPGTQPTSGQIMWHALKTRPVQMGSKLMVAGTPFRNTVIPIPLGGGVVSRKTPIQRVMTEMDIAEENMTAREKEAELLRQFRARQERM